MNRPHAIEDLNIGTLELSQLEMAQLSVVQASPSPPKVVKQPCEEAAQLDPSTSKTTLTMFGGTIIIICSIFVPLYVSWALCQCVHVYQNKPAHAASWVDDDL